MCARNVKKNYLEVPYWNGVKHKVTNGGISRFLICNCFKPPITTSQLFHSRRESIFLDYRLAQNTVKSRSAAVASEGAKPSKAFKVFS